jgi:copper chaperone CopZ
MLKDVRLAISGMHCGGCVRRVTAALGEVEGLSEVSVEVGAARFDAEDADALKEATGAVEALGFGVVPTGVGGE